MDIVRLGHKSTVGVLNEGDQIIIQEKIDGANASFKKEDGVIKCYSRNQELSEQDALRGFYNWVVSNVNLNSIGKGYVFFGEWLVKHKIDYGESMNQFYLFDIYDEKEEKYLDFSNVRIAAKALDLNLIPVFYQGEYQGFDHLMQFVGKSSLGEVGEGIVVKNVNYKDRFGNQMFVKLVSDQFREVQKQKAPKDPNKPETSEMTFTRTFVTEARIEKFLHKFVDEGILDEQFGIEDMGVILKNMNPRILEDLLKEESDSLPEDYDEKQLRKSINNVVANTLRQKLSKIV